jgi:hypothetical protein
MEHPKRKQILSWNQRVGYVLDVKEKASMLEV